ncbi:hypothetical protein MPH_02907 [Macrophomina phaseolina MS6]|uniref:Uncharacterized protein n=1 Tax=Macrophomina phaseolina (strain MS6) TaxID=1126212 RepID=K2RB70_MACPH|nr:hypothetical protein MPH_02907 [Macrophomina phaseolina MS6]
MSGTVLLDQAPPHAKAACKDQMPQHVVSKGFHPGPETPELTRAVSRASACRKPEVIRCNTYQWLQQERLVTKTSCLWFGYHNEKARPAYEGGALARVSRRYPRSFSSSWMAQVPATLGFFMSDKCYWVLSPGYLIVDQRNLC